MSKKSMGQRHGAPPLWSMGRRRRRWKRRRRSRKFSKVNHICAVKSLHANFSEFRAGAAAQERVWGEEGNSKKKNSNVMSYYVCVL